MKIGSRAIFLCEPCQDRKVAALSIRRMCCGIAHSERAVFLCKEEGLSVDSPFCVLLYVCLRIQRGRGVTGQYILLGNVAVGAVRIDRPD